MPKNKPLTIKTLMARLKIAQKHLGANAQIYYETPERVIALRTMRSKKEHIQVGAGSFTFMNVVYLSR